MASKSQELKQKAESLYRNMKDLMGKSDLTKEDDVKFDQWNTEYEDLMGRAAKFEKIEKLEVEQAASDEVENLTKKKGEMTVEKQREVLNVALKEYYIRGKISDEAKSILKPAAAENDDKDLINKEYQRLGLRAAQQSTTDGSGGYTIPQGFQAELETAMLAYGGMLDASRIWRTNSGNTVDWPKVNDTANRAYLIGEAVNAETSATKITDAQQQFEAYKITSGMLRLSSEIVEDSAFDMVGTVKEFLSERMARGINYYTTLADGSSKPKGVTLAAYAGNNTADDAALASLDFLNLEHEIDPAYRVNSRFMFHDNVMKAIKKISVASTTVYPLWLPDFRSSEPGTILGHPYSINQDMFAYVDGSASANDNQKIALFGNFQKYVIRLVNNMRIVRLNERFGDTDEIALCAFWRIDGDLLDAGTHPIKYMRASAT